MKKILLSALAFAAIALATYAQCPWTEYATGFTTASRGINDVCAVNDQFVWATAYDGSGGGAPCQQYTRSTNGGLTWTPGTIPGITALDLAMVSAINDQQAWIVAYPPGATTTGQGIYYTSNGGTTWAKQASALFTNAASFVNCVHFWNANDGWCMGDPINGEYEIYTTTNGGTNWVAVPGSQIPNPVSGEFGIVGYYSVVNDIVWFGTNKGRVYKSVDKGNNWTVAVCTPLNNKYIQPYFKDENFGFCQDKNAATTGALAQTTDGGATWTAVTNTGTVYWNDLGFVPTTTGTWVSTGAASGSSGVTYSYDNGASWTEWLDCQGTQFLATAWIDTETGWAGSFNTDATTGGMWVFTGNLIPPVPPVADFVANNTGIALGDQVIYTDLSTGDPTSWAWTFEGGSPGTSYIQTPPPITYSTPGTWDVTLSVSNVNGTDTKTIPDYIYVGGVGINDQSMATVTIFPNPVTDVLNISGSATIQEVQVLSLVGQVVCNQKVDNSTVVLNLDNLKAGVYNLRVKMADGFVNKKIVVN